MLVAYIFIVHYTVKRTVSLCVLSLKWARNSNVTHVYMYTFSLGLYSNTRIDLTLFFYLVSQTSVSFYNHSFDAKEYYSETNVFLS